MRHFYDASVKRHPVDMDVVNLHECRDEDLIFLLFNIPYLSICWCDDTRGDGSLWVSEENKEKYKDAKNRDKTGEEP
jgi:hypothetical protein